MGILNAPLWLSVTLESSFIKKLSLEAQEAWSSYLVDMALAAYPEITTHTHTSDRALLKTEINALLLIKQALKSKEHAHQCAQFMREIPQDMLSKELFVKIIDIDDIYKKIEWIKKYAL